MYGSSTAEAFAAIPELPELDAEVAKRILSTIYLDVIGARVQGVVISSNEEIEQRLRYLRRLVNALESYAIFDELPRDAPVRDGAAFVAAEALALAGGLAGASEGSYSYRLAHPKNLAFIEAGLLYICAGFDADATPCARAVPARSIDTRHIESRFAEWACDALRSLLYLRPEVRAEPRPPTETEIQEDLFGATRAALFRELGQIVNAHLSWLAGGGDDPHTLDDRVQRLSDVLAQEYAIEHADIHHLARLVQRAIMQTRGRALRAVPIPDGRDADEYETYLSTRARGNGVWPQPVLWPPTARFVDECLRGGAVHAVISAPTGSGKSGIAEIALSHAVGQGWAVYIVPTNALANQVRSDLATTLGNLDGVQIRSFIGDAEYNVLQEESLGDDEAGAGTVVVMTPEKCALALRLRPTLFANCRLCVFDECHLLADGTRGALAELVISHILAAAQQCRFVLMSAMVANPEDLQGWIQEVTDQQTAVVHDPWRPTRTLRTAVGLDRDQTVPAAEEALVRLNARSARFQRESFEATLALIAGLRGPWVTGDENDYALLRLPMQTTARVTRNRLIEGKSWTNTTSAVLSQHLAQHGFSVLTFTPADPHHAFAVARQIELPSGGREQLSDRTLAYLEIADDELGVESKVRERVEHGVALHTAALLDAERAASERAFRDGSCPVMVATGTLAQGLNLPATAVVIAGTSVGDRRAANTPEGRDRTQAQLLNAVGRSGRAGIANQGLSIVVPDKPALLDSPADGQRLRQRLPFLANEDDSTTVRSRLRSLVAQALDGELELRAATPEDLVAYSYLPYEADAEQITAREIIRNTLAISTYDAPADAPEVVAEAVRRTGSAFFRAADAPEWLPRATYRTGYAFFQTLRFQQARQRWLAQDHETPKDILGWLDHLIDILRLLPPDRVQEVIGRKVGATRVRILWESEDGDDPSWVPPTAWNDAWETMRVAVREYMRGAGVLKIAEVVEGEEVTSTERTTGGLPIPRAIALINGFIERLSRLGGLLLAAEELDPRLLLAEDVGNEASDAWLALARMPLAVRCGCGDPSSLAWYRFGVRFRRPAHALARIFPVPEEARSDTATREWIGAQLGEWLLRDDLSASDSSEAERKLLLAARRVA